MYAPQRPSGRRKGDGDSYVAARHPGTHSVEQLYDLREDPNEQQELIAAHRLLVSPNEMPQPQLDARASEAAEALHSFRTAMQRDLLKIASGCGV